MSPIVYLNGQFVPQNQAKVSIMDRGFLFGDGVYEVIPVHNGHIMTLKPHLSRLKRSLKMIYLKPPMNEKEWKSVLETLLEKNKQIKKAKSIYLQVTRGAENTRSHAFPDHYTPTVLAFLIPSKAYPRQALNQGFSAITLDDTRRSDCHIKAITLLPNILSYEKARRLGAIEAILIREGKAVECTSSNLFIVHNKQLLTPPLSPSILSGVTRQLVISLAKQHHMPFKEANITESMLFNASEIWVTGSSKEICPITQLNNQAIGNGKVGPFFLQMIEYYEEYKNHLGSDNDLLPFV